MVGLAWTFFLKIIVGLAFFLFFVFVTFRFAFEILKSNCGFLLNEKDRNDLMFLSKVFMNKICFSKHSILMF